MLASFASAQEVTDANGLHFHLTAEKHTAELTFLATDSTNATAYAGELNVPSSVTVDGQAYAVTGVTQLACSWCDALASVTLPEGVDHIGLGAFSDCSRLSQVTLPSSLTAIHDLAFYRDSSLTEISIPGGVRRLGACSFAYCQHLDSVTLQASLHSIAYNSFYYCTALRSLVMPETLQAIGENAFAYCTGLEQIIMLGRPVAITPDVFRGVDIANCRLIVPSNCIEDYREMEVWRDFMIVDGGFEDLPDMEQDEAGELFTLEVIGGELVITVKGDAPALVYDLMGRRIAVCDSLSGENRIPLARGREYIIRCSTRSQVIAY